MPEDQPPTISSLPGNRPWFPHNKEVKVECPLLPLPVHELGSMQEQANKRSCAMDPTANENKRMSENENIYAGKEPVHAMPLPEVNKPTSRAVLSNNKVLAGEFRCICTDRSAMKSLATDIGEWGIGSYNQFHDHTLLDNIVSSVELTKSSGEYITSLSGAFEVLEVLLDRDSIPTSTRGQKGCRGITSLWMEVRRSRVDIAKLAFTITQLAYQSRLLAQFCTSQPKEKAIPAGCSSFNKPRTILLCRHAIWCYLTRVPPSQGSLELAYKCESPRITRRLPASLVPILDHITIHYRDLKSTSAAALTKIGRERYEIIADGTDINQLYQLFVNLFLYFPSAMPLYIKPERDSCDFGLLLRIALESCSDAPSSSICSNSLVFFFCYAISEIKRIDDERERLKDTNQEINQREMYLNCIDSNLLNAEITCLSSIVSNLLSMGTRHSHLANSIHALNPELLLWLLQLSQIVIVKTFSSLGDEYVISRVKDHTCSRSTSIIPSIDDIVCIVKVCIVQISHLMRAINQAQIFQCDEQQIYILKTTLRSVLKIGESVSVKQNITFLFSSVTCNGIAECILTIRYLLMKRDCRVLRELANLSQKLIFDTFDEL